MVPKSGTFGTPSRSWWVLKILGFGTYGFQCDPVNSWPPLLEELMVISVSPLMIKPHIMRVSRRDRVGVQHSAVLDVSILPEYDKYSQVLGILRIQPKLLSTHSNPNTKCIMCIIIHDTQKLSIHPIWYLSTVNSQILSTGLPLRTCRYWFFAYMPVLVIVNMLIFPVFAKTSGKNRWVIWTTTQNTEHDFFG